MYINVEVEQVKRSEEDKYFNLSDKWIKQEQYGRNHTCKGPNIDKRWTYHKGIIIITRSFHDKFHIGSMGMNAEFKVDSHFSNAYPFIHFSLSMKL